MIRAVLLLVLIIVGFAMWENAPLIGDLTQHPVRVLAATLVLTATADILTDVWSAVKTLRKGGDA